MILGHLRQNIVAYLALAVALSTGSAYAAAQIANGSITTKKLAKNAVTSPKIKRAAVTSDDIAPNAVDGSRVRDGSLGPADLSAGTIPQVDFLKVVTIGNDPVATPDSPAALSTVVAVPRAGTLLTRVDIDNVTLTCSAGAGTYGLYVDGAPVPDTGGGAPGPGATRSLFVNAAVPVAAGSHTVSFGVDCTSGSINSVSYSGSASWTFAINGS